MADGEDFQKGISYAAWWHDAYLRPESDRALEALADTGADWVSLIATWYQGAVSDDTLSPSLSKTPSDQALVHAVRKLRSLGLSVMLKPHVDLLDGTQFRESIRPSDPEKWFASYREFMGHYARLAEAEGVQQLSVGAELTSMTVPGYTAYWTDLIAEVRRTYHGRLLYAANPTPRAGQRQPEWRNVCFWDELDFAGIDAYFPLAEKDGPTVAELESGWGRWSAQIHDWQEETGKPVILTEIGYRDVVGAGRNPPEWQSQPPGSQQEQADCYEAAFRALLGEPWLRGLYWWVWTPAETEPGDYSPRGKLAEEVLRSWYGR